MSLTPLLRATDSFVRAFGLLIALWVVAGSHAAFMHFIPPLLSPTARLLASALLAAMLVSCLELAIEAQALTLYQGSGIYRPLIGIYCMVSDWSRQAANDSLRLTFSHMASASILMLILALLRKLLGNGSLLSHADWLLATHNAWCHR